MKDTTKALADLRAHWLDAGCPASAKIAKKANIAPATAHRYLSGITKLGTPEVIRALAIAMDRNDIAESLKFVSLDGNEHSSDYIAELHKQWDETAQQRLDDAVERHKAELEKLRTDHSEERQDLLNHASDLRKMVNAVIVEKWIFAALFAVSMILHHHK